MSVTTNRSDIFMAISIERERQDRLHPDDNYPDSVFLAVLMEEVGEVAQAMLEDNPKQLRDELIQVAAVCVRMLERGERREMSTFPSLETLEASHEREKRLRENIASRIREEASSQGGSLTAVVRIQAYEYVLDMLNERSYEEDK